MSTVRQCEVDVESDRQRLRSGICTGLQQKERVFLPRARVAWLALTGVACVDLCMGNCGSFFFNIFPFYLDILATLRRGLPGCHAEIESGGRGASRDRTIGSLESICRAGQSSRDLPIALESRNPARAWLLQCQSTLWPSLAYRASTEENEPVASGCIGPTSRSFVRSDETSSSPLTQMSAWRSSLHASFSHVYIEW